MNPSGLQWVLDKIKTSTYKSLLWVSGMKYWKWILSMGHIPQFHGEGCGQKSVVQGIPGIHSPQNS